MAKILCDCLARGLPQAMAVSVAGIGRESFYKWKREDPSFLARVEQAIAAGVDARLKKIEEAGSTDWRAAAWWLEHCQPEHFAKTRIQVEAVGQIDHAFVIPQETLNQIAEARAKIEQAPALPAPLEVTGRKE